MQYIVLGISFLLYWSSCFTKKCQLLYSKKKMLVIICAGVVCGCIVIIQALNSTTLYVDNISVKNIINNEIIEEKEKEVREEAGKDIDLNYFRISDVNEFVKVSPDYLKNILISIIVVLLVWILCNKSIIVKYCDNLQFELYQITHKWLNDKTLKNILVSVQIASDDNLYIKDICQYFSEELRKGEAKTYIVLGNPGEGKTVSLNKVCEMILDIREEAEKYKKITYKIKNYVLKRKKRNLEDTKEYEGYIPVMLNFLDIAEISHHDDLHKIILEQIYDIAGSHYIVKFDNIRQRMNKVISTKIKQGKFVFLIDGYDEINDNRRRHICRIINSYRKEFSKCSFIISSRTAVFERRNYLNIKKENILHLVPFSDDKIIEFLSQWEFSTGKKYWELYEKIINNYQLNRLAENPLLLTLIAYLYDESKLNIPNSICEFYEESTKCLLEKWEEEKNTKEKSGIELQEKILFLEEAANWILSNKKYAFEKLEIVEALNGINKYGTSQKHIFDEIYLQSGILEKHKDYKENSNEKYKFYHRSFYEFFLAKYMVEKGINNDSWMFENENYQVAFFYLSLSKDMVRLNKYIKEKEELLYVIEELLIECDIQDSKVIYNYVAKKKRQEKKNEKYYQALGRIAGKYRCVQRDVYNYFVAQFKKNIYKDTLQITYIIKAMSYFVSSDKVLSLIVDYIHIIDWEKLTKANGIQLDNYYFSILESDIEQVYKVNIINGLAFAGKYLTLYEILKKLKKYDVKNHIMNAFLHLTKERKFIQWVMNINLIQYMDEDAKKQINRWKKEYGWKWEELSDIQANQRYMFVYILIYNSQNNSVDLSKISNRIKFVSSYIQNEEKAGEVKAYYVDIPGYKVKSTIEFRYHWKRNKITENMSYNPILLRNILYGGCFLVIILLIMFWLINKTSYYNCVQEIKRTLDYYRISDYDEYCRIISALDNKKIANLKISKYIVPNSHMFIFISGWILLQTYTYKQYIDKPYNYLYKSIYWLMALLYLNLYFLIFQDFVFRIGGVIMVLLALVVSMTQHRYNMPSFRAPLFSDIRKYLERDMF